MTRQAADLKTGGLRYLLVAQRSPFNVAACYYGKSRRAKRRALRYKGRCLCERLAFLRPLFARIARAKNQVSGAQNALGGTFAECEALLPP